jgi:hypothetical protein
MKTNKIYITLVALMFSGAVFGQEKDTTYWQYAERIGFNFNTASFSSNWTGGGSNNISLSALFLGNWNYKKDKIGWDNELDLQYGILKNKDQNARKSNDRIYMDSKLGYALSKNWNLFSALNFQTQFGKGYNFGTDANGAETRELISDFLAPAFITSSWGAEYKPNEYFNLRIAPFSPRITLVTDTTLHNQISGNYGVEIGETVRYEWLAAKIVASFEKDLVKDIHFKARYELFVNFQEFETKKFDHRLDLALSAKVFKALTVSLMSTLIYDYDQIDEIQTNFLTGIGLLYTFGNIPE